MAMDPLDEAEYWRRQRARANITGMVLIGLAVLFFAITVAKLSLAQ